MSELTDVLKNIRQEENKLIGELKIEKWKQQITWSLDFKNKKVQIIEQK